MDYTKFFNLPIVASAHGHEVDKVIYLVHLLMLLLFVGWAIFFVYVIYRFRKRRHPKATHHGVHSPFATAVEIAVIIAEAVLLIGFSIPIWQRQVNAFPERKDMIEVRVVGEQFAWNIHYPGKDGIFGSTNIKFFNKETNSLGLDPEDPHGKDDIVTINQLHLPIGRPVKIYLSSKDVIHSFSLPVMRVKQDAIPGLTIPLWFIPTKTGNFEIACAQLCGLGHYRMIGYLTIDTQEQFDKWLGEQSSEKEGEENYDDFWN